MSTPPARQMIDPSASIRIEIGFFGIQRGATPSGLSRLLTCWKRGGCR